MLDVRQPDEFNGGHVPSAINIPIKSITTEPTTAFERIRGAKQVVVHCARSLHKGPAAAISLKTVAEQSGDDIKIVVLKGGMDEWRRRYASEDGLVV